MEAQESSKRRRPVRMLSWRPLMLWYGTAFVFCIAGAFAHDKLFTTEIWRRWAETKYDPGLLHLTPVWSDVGRAVVGLWLSILGLIWLDVVSSRHERRINELRLAPYELVTMSVLWTCALFFAYYVLPVNFFFECTSLVSTGFIKGPVQFSLGEVWWSYVLYSPYVIGLWVGMVYPIFFFFVRSIRADYGRWIALDRNAEEIDSENADESTVTEVWDLWLRRYHVLKNVAVHYVPVLIFISVLVIFEKMIFHVSATRHGDDYGLAALSLMLLPAAVITAIVFTMLYSRQREQTEVWFSNVADLAERRHDRKLRAAAHEKLAQLDTHSDLKFLWNVLTSRGILLTFIFGIGNIALQYAFPTVLQAFTGTGAPVQATSQPSAAYHRKR
jgi:hypothetical protein